MKTVEAATDRWYGVLCALGFPDESLTGKHGPCPLCGGKDRFRFDDKDGRGTYYCGGCGAGNGMQLAMKWTGLNFKECAKRIDELLGHIESKPRQPKRDPAKLLSKISSTLKPCDGINPVSLYLRKRGLSPVRGLWWSPEVSYFEDGKFHSKQNAMVATITAPTGEPLSLHLTYLTKDGVKAPVRDVKKVMTPVSPMAGAAVRLFQPRDGVIGVAEGIETALAAARLFNVPCWAAVNATLLEQFQPPDGIKSVFVFGDNDANYTGQKAAYALAHKLSMAGYGVSVKIPDQVGKDFADQIGSAA